MAASPTGSCTPSAPTAPASAATPAASASAPATPFAALLGVPAVSSAATPAVAAGPTPAVDAEAPAAALDELLAALPTLKAPAVAATPSPAAPATANADAGTDDDSTDAAAPECAALAATLLPQPVTATFVTPPAADASAIDVNAGRAGMPNSWLDNLRQQLLLPGAPEAAQKPEASLAALPADFRVPLLAADPASSATAATAALAMTVVEPHKLDAALTPADLSRLPDFATLAPANASSDVAPTAAPPAQPPLHPQQADWSAQLAQRMIVSVHNGDTRAELQLHPHDFGAVEVRIKIEGNQASLWFGADQSQAREAIAQAIPALRERFAAEGMNLVQAEVSQQQHSRGGEGRAPMPSQPFVAATVATTGETPAETRVVRLGIVDDYA